MKPDQSKQLLIPQFSKGKKGEAREVSIYKTRQEPKFKVNLFSSAFLSIAYHIGRSFAFLPNHDARKERGETEERILLYALHEQKSSFSPTHFIRGH